MNPKTINALRAWIFGLLVVFAGNATAQDIHFSQFYHAPLSLNPALAAVHRGDVRFTANYRGQWYSALVPYTTFNATVENRFPLKHRRNQYFGGGLTFRYDAAGDAELSLANIRLSGSYTYGLDKENFLSIGVMAGFAQRSFDPASLTFDSQFNGDQYDPGRPTNEDFTTTVNYFADFAAGINYYGQSSTKRSTFYAGAGVFHLNRPDQSFYESDNAILPMRFSLYLFPTIQIAEKFDLAFAGSAQFQQEYVELLGMAGLKIFLSQKRSKEVAIQLGSTFRFNSFGDAIIPTGILYYRAWTFGFSYDINISDFSTATNGLGGPEFSVRYTITNVKPFENFRVCRLY